MNFFSSFTQNNCEKISALKDRLNILTVEVEKRRKKIDEERASAASAVTNTQTNALQILTGKGTEIQKVIAKNSFTGGRKSKKQSIRYAKTTKRRYYSH